MFPGSFNSVSEVFEWFYGSLVDLVILRGLGRPLMVFKGGLRVI